jgi:hypothetical protein
MDEGKGKGRGGWRVEGGGSEEGERREAEGTPYAYTPRPVQNQGVAALP